MGTDIELFIEIDTSIERESPPPPPFSREDNIRYITGEEIFIGRPYSIFHALANERCRGDRRCLIEPRGFPEFASKKVISKYYWRVFDGPPKVRTGMNWMTLRDSEELVNSGRGHYRYTTLSRFTAEKYKLVSHPEATAVSYLNHVELVASLEFFGITIDANYPAFKLVLSILSEAEKIYGSQRSRIVFWFLY